jgi:hypothetical protein
MLTREQRIEAKTREVQAAIHPVSHPRLTKRTDNRHRHKVRCVETKKVYPSMNDAARAHGVSQASIRSAVVHKHRSCGVHWELV